MTDLAPHVFGLPPGVDFARELVSGLDARLPGLAPEDWARVEIWANSPRMRRQIAEAYRVGARVIPRLRVLSDLVDPALPAPVPVLRRQLDLARLVAALIERQPGIAPRENAFALARSLARILDEMQGEGVTPEAIAAIDVTDLSGHWARSLEFLQIVQDWAGAGAGDPEGLRRMTVLRLGAAWEQEPPDHPVIIAGSTGSRGTTALFMQAVARLPMGAVVLPGFDPDMPDSVWSGLNDARAAEDHPQYRFRRLADMLGLDPGRIPLWTGAAAPCPARNALVSLSLRPAPVTDLWISEGPGLGDLAPATADITLIEAPSPRLEAEAIALRMRHAVERGQSAALITPDRMLGRQVSAALDRWDLIADDSAGQPLALTPPGRLLRQIARLRIDRTATAAELIATLRHPLCHSGAERGGHLLETHKLELQLRDQGPPWPDGAAIRALGDSVWHLWLAALLDRLPAPSELPLTDHVAAHLALAQDFAAGSATTGSGGLWDEAAGRNAKLVMADLERHAGAGGSIDPTEYALMFEDVLASGPATRTTDAAHPLLRILGPREAREAVADLVILGGLNEGSWPALPAPDPWLNRAMRLRAGLLLPERQIGLSAHDYQQAMAAPEIWLTRSLRSDSAETVPSRWLSRLTNLLSGLPDQGGRAALERMRAEGARWIAGARQLSQPESTIPPEPRPSPAPPAGMRPRRLSVTTIERLVRDPYAVYARQILRLNPLGPLTPQPDAPLRGTILHRVFETVLREGFDPLAGDARDRLIATAERVMTEDCPWPLMRRQWLARLARSADWFIATEADRQAQAEPRLFEEKAGASVADTGVTLTAEADRIDIASDGRAYIYDYKSGKPPTVKQQGAFNKQLLLEAALLEQGGFATLGPMPVADAAFIGLFSETLVPAPIEDHPPARVWAELAQLLRNWADPARGYTARMAQVTEGSSGEYDHLSRFGEWDATTAPTRQVLE